jgi:tetratricopeptide (TPR) repeat protein
MTETDQDLQQLLSELGNTPSGPARVALLEAAAERAEAEGAPAELHLRLTLDLSGEHGLQGRHAPRLPLFERCQELAAEVDELDPELERGLRWQQKQLVQKLVDTPEIELKRIEVLEADYEGWLSRSGLSTHSVLGARAERALHRGDHDRARRLVDQWAAAQPDGMSDCPACDAERRVALLHELGEPGQAVELGLSAIEKQVDCRNQPQGLLAAMAEPLAEGQLPDLARVAHMRSYRVQRQQPELNIRLDAHLLFCARTGNLERGREIIDRHVDLLGLDQSPRVELRLCAAAARLVDGLTSAGQSGELDLPAAFGGRQPLPEAARALAARARELAGRFDARNGTKAVSQWVERTVAAPALPAVPMLEQPASPEPEPEPVPADPEELMRQVARGVPAAQARIHEVEPAADDSVHRRALVAIRRMWSNDVPAVIDELAEVVEAFEERGEHALAMWVRTRLARLLDDRDDGRLEEHLADLAEKDLALAEPALWDAPLRIHGLLSKRDTERAAAFAERIRPLLETDDVLARFVLPVLDAQQAFGRQELEEAAQQLQAAARAELSEQYPAQPQLYVREGSAAMLAGLLIDVANEAAAATVELNSVVAACDEHGVAVRPSLYLALSRALLNAATEQPPELEPFLLALRSCERSGSCDERAQARQWLAKAYLQHGREIEAAELLESALPLSRNSLDHPVRMEIRFQLARLRRHFGEHAGAAEILEPVVGEALDTSAMMPSALGEVVVEASSALWDSGEQERAAEMLQRGIDWQRAGGEVITLVALLQHWARMQNMAGDPEPALQTLDSADAELAQADIEEQQHAALQALLNIDRSRSLVLTGRHEDSLELLETTEKSVAELPEQLAAVRQRRVEVLLETGQPADAEKRARELLNSLDEQTLQQHGGNTARLLAQALDQQQLDWQSDEQLAQFLQQG